MNGHPLNGRRLPASLFVFGLTAVLASCGGGHHHTSPAVSIKTLSNRADLVSDGDALVEVVLPANTTAAGLKVDVGGRDVSAAFSTTRSDGRIIGRIDGLAVGDNVVTAWTTAASPARLTITNADRGGPVFTGAQPMPYFCATPTPVGATATAPATTGSGLTTNATDAKCNIATEFKLYYKSTAAGCTFGLPDPVNRPLYTSASPPATVAPPANPCFKPYTAGTTPADMASTTTDAGVTVPYIVRVERGTINRGIYDIAVLFNPNAAWNPVQPQAQWNGKLIYFFGASTGQPRRQVRPATAWTDDRSLSRGYMVAVNSMTDSLQNSNRVVMTETTMMMKEHIGDTYGPIKFTQGSGCSGGSIASNMVSSIGPGLLDGITTSCTYPDSETVTMEVADCVLLVEAYQKPQWLALQSGATSAQVNAKKAAINGHLDQSACHGWYNSFGSNAKPGNYNQRVVPPAANDTGAITTLPTTVNNCELPNALVYDKTNNPAGARCNAWSWAESIWGKVPGQAWAKDTRDNVGVQYGLKAFQANKITAEEFVTLNEIIGGTDRDTELSTARTVADADALNIAYRAGIVLSGKSLSKVAVIDMRGYDDSVIDLPPGLLALGIPAANLQGVALFGIHHQWRSFSIRDRLDRDAGGHGNQVMWRFGLSGFAPSTALATDAFTQMDQWLTTLKADTSSKTLEQKVLAAKPAASSDYCLLSTDPAQATKVTDQAACDADKYLAVHSSPRQVAGGARTEDILKCQLKAIDVNDYAAGGGLLTGHLARLQAVFPDGVCDWSKPGVGQQASVAPLTFKAGPGGQPLPAEPVSK
ncbi:DUF6351 family protein [Variovorax sp. J22R133]|uniref:DUF6351 family protein n=1 Tax=Variovorax brevis TaxID=3053503 RepID=UPI0025790B82|nr:DUF6351 family protein [Variovorax sp. J22R133]MDM0117213.1 DUF6351 family protein [Variovorax sp. J22R133]